MSVLFDEWASTDRLALDTDGHLYERYRGGWHWLGPVADADVPDSLDGERAELLDLWHDAIAAADWRAEVCATYHAGLF